MLVFSVYIPFLISRVRPVHSIFEKKSILENPSQIFTNLFFHAYFAVPEEHPPIRSVSLPAGSTMTLSNAVPITRTKLFSDKLSYFAYL